jgi:hypothetical protein
MRTPVGDSAGFVRRLPTSSQCGISHGKSPRTVMSTFFDCPVAGSYVWIQPPCS